MVITRDERIGLVGVGALGSNMLSALQRDGWPVTVHDRNQARAQSLAQGTQRVATSVEQLSDCSVVGLVVPDDDAVRQVLDGPEGLFGRLADGSTIILHSTVLPRTAQELGKRAQDLGLRLLDAPVSGGEERARAGDLTIMVGGDRSVLDDVRPILESLGSEIILMGPTGAGAATKLANQLMLFANLGGVLEALDLATAYGVSEAAVLEAVGSSLGESWVTRNWGFFDAAVRSYDRLGTPVQVRPWKKDLGEVVLAAREADLDLPHASLLAHLLADRVERYARRH